MCEIVLKVCYVTAIRSVGRRLTKLNLTHKTIKSEAAVAVAGDV